jgi:hypothetical protein
MKESLAKSSGIAMLRGDIEAACDPNTPVVTNVDALAKDMARLITLRGDDL